MHSIGDFRSPGECNWLKWPAIGCSSTIGYSLGGRLPKFVFTIKVVVRGYTYVLGRNRFFGWPIYFSFVNRTKSPLEESKHESECLVFILSLLPRQGGWSSASLTRWRRNDSFWPGRWGGRNCGKYLVRVSQRRRAHSILVRWNRWKHSENSRSVGESSHDWHLWRPGNVLCVSCRFGASPCSGPRFVMSKLYLTNVSISSVEYTYSLLGTQYTIELYTFCKTRCSTYNTQRRSRIST